MVAHAKAQQYGLLEEGEKSWEVKDWKKRIKELEVDEDVKYR